MQASRVLLCRLGPRRLHASISPETLSPRYLEERLVYLLSMRWHITAAISLLYAPWQLTDIRIFETYSLYSISHDMDGPALPAPPDITPNLDHPSHTRQAVAKVALCILLTFPIIAVPLRAYVRRFLMNAWNLTDCCCTLACILFIALVSIAFVMLDYGFGVHAYDLRLSKFIKFAEIINIQQIVYMPAILFTKVSVLMQLLDIFAPQRPSWRWWTLLALIVANSCFFTILFFIEIFECIPRKKIWMPSLPGHCININQTFVASAVINVIDDFLILALPISWIIKLHMNSRRKLGISFIFATGLL